MRRPLRAVTMMVSGVALAVLAPLLLTAPAYASCMLPARVSAHPFTGTVIGVTNAGRTVTVRTDDGRVVTVRGSEAEEPNAATTVDRAYQLGTRYEFHPINDTDPYQDNSCTATHQIGTAPTNPANPTSLAVPSGGSSSGRAVAVAVGGIGGAGIAAGMGIWLLFRRRTRSAS